MAHVRIIEEPSPPASVSVKFAVLAVVREALFEMPERASQVAIGPKRRQIMSRVFPYVDVALVTDDELLDRLREDIAATIERLSEPELAES